MKAAWRQAGLDLLAGAAREGALGGRSFRVRGCCMAPLLADGDTVTLAATEEPLLPGQVVLARAGAELLCHRLLDCSDGFCRLAGDGDLRLDELPLADVIGRVAAIATPRFGGCRLELPAAPAFLDRFFAGWLGWSCRRRGFLQLRLEGLRRRLLARRAARSWQRAATVATVGAER
jgi:hypothetical protein